MEKDVVSESQAQAPQSTTRTDTDGFGAAVPQAPALAPASLLAIMLPEFSADPPEVRKAGGRPT